MRLAKATLIWAALVGVVCVPIALASTSSLLEWRGPIYILAGFSDISGLGLLLFQPLLREYWLRDLQGGKFDSVEALAASVKLHPKVVRKELRYAFLAPSITEAILTGEQPPTLTPARIPKTLPLTWSMQTRTLGF